MSAPNTEQCRQILERVSALLDEYDHIKYSLFIRDEDSMWHSMMRLVRRDRVVVARALLDDALEPRGKRGRT